MQGSEDGTGMYGIPT